MQLKIRTHAHIYIGALASCDSEQRIMREQYHLLGPALSFILRHLAGLMNPLQIPCYTLSNEGVDISVACISQL